ncbi:hypothetical protein [Herbaspirillum sp. RV1423]|uniref:hypothetical protein n=1 Tax=Herbaspirillum sp. RV1423 TaxID=1443993 RepID=UPI000684E8F5|nr:hypothetical protein [Herbaspirillum sp. RV1423]
MVWRKRSSVLNKLLFPQVLPSLMANTPAAPSGASRPDGSGQHKPVAFPKQRERMMHITVESSDVTRLRHVVMESCGYCVCFMRMSPLDHARKMQLCLCVQAEAVPIVMDAVMWALPQAEFGLRQQDNNYQ